MNKKYLYATIFFALIIVILFFIINKFDGKKENLTGTIGKVEKYRKVQMTENDVKLRNDLLTDTSALSKSIKGILFFYDFSKTMASELPKWTESIKNTKINALDKEVNILTDYSQFLDKNLKTLENTLSLILDVYNGDTTEASVNMEKNIKEFENFVVTLTKKDSMLVSVFPAFDKVIKTYTNVPDRKEAVKTIIDVKEKFAINCFVLSCFVGNKSLLVAVSNTAILNKDNLGIIYCSKADLSNTVNKSLGVIIFGNKGVDAINSKNLGTIYGSGIPYTGKSDLGKAEQLGGGGNYMSFETFGATVFNNMSTVANKVLFNQVNFNAATLQGVELNNKLEAVLLNKLEAKLNFVDPVE